MTSRRMAPLAPSRRPNGVCSSPTASVTSATCATSSGYRASRYRIDPTNKGVAAAERIGVAPLDHAPRSPTIAAIDELIDALASRSPG